MVTDQHRTRRPEQHSDAAFDCSGQTNMPRQTGWWYQGREAYYDFEEDGYQQPRRISQRSEDVYE